MKPPIIALLAVEFENGWRKEADENWKWTLPDEMLDNYGTWKIEQDLTEIVEHFRRTEPRRTARLGFGPRGP